MPGVTAYPWQIPYAIGSDFLTDGDNAIKGVSDRLHALLTQNLFDTPQLNIGMALAPNWTGTAEYTLRSGWVSLYIDVTLPAGGWGANSQFATLPSNYRPNKVRYDWAMFTSNGAPFPVFVNPAGQVCCGLPYTAGNNRFIGSINYPIS